MESAYKYMLGLPENERTENVKAMVNIILLEAEREIEEAYTEGLNEGAELGEP